MRIRTAKTFAKYQVGSFEGNPNCIGIMMIRSLYGIKEDRDVIITKLSMCGISDEYLKEKRDASTFLDAIQAMEEDGFIRKIDNRYDSIAYQVVGESLQKAADEAGLPRLKFSDKAVVRFYKTGRGPKAGEVESDTPGVADVIKALMETEKTIVRTGEVAGLLNRTMTRDAESIGMTRTGSAYFMPYNPQQIEIATKVQKFIGMLSGACSCFLLPVAGNNPENRMSVMSALNTNVENTLRDIDKGISEISILLADPEAKDPAGKVKSLFERIKQSKNRIEAYCDLLGMQQEKLVAKLESASAKLSAITTL